MIELRPALLLALIASWPAAGRDDPCLRCHLAEEPGQAALLAGPHGSLSDPRSPMAADGCAACHGASLAHRRRPTEAPDLVFAAHESSARRNQPCLECHRDAALHWDASAHARADLACHECHQAHVHDFPRRGAEERVEACLGCHGELRASLARPFNHPLGAADFDCGACHDPHGGLERAALREPGRNETCYRCHADLRGPFLWEHRPVREDCGDCHAAHGSIHPGMLQARAPFLCQFCHMAQFHPSTLHSGTGLPGVAAPSGSAFLLGQNCMNCHPAVHGSNHPSGARLTR
jgi:DmsE family decaheme c-type cytochrome